eukprot:9527614-Alexandrium_andersonii.AAC.1
MPPKATRLQTVHVRSSISHDESVRGRNALPRTPTGRDRSALELRVRSEANRQTGRVLASILSW